MGQVTEETCRFIIEYADRDKRFPLTVNEMRQLAYLANQQIQAARRTTPDREAWQPIETAPKDGKRVLVFEPGSRGGVWVAHFLRYPGKPDQWVNPGCHKINPTHWMPLPTAPTSDKGGA
ncbi:DUF551 domain-containing protein [Burkholderia cenocepacia]|uniref:DUF551 domain-containing protein n=1 Tax=Burkholderia cenocepacia TaxID=95486 RepID=UPI002231DF35|nr:DUF551 domain-containing protein [Burkholderia cenocepacia]MCW3675432.1 DUF551 domain-containing protein [Burkholderia cenocepacia]